MIIAVDGPTASGKGTIAKALAAHFGLPHLDTGLLYRAVGVNAVRLGVIPTIRTRRWQAARSMTRCSPTRICALKPQAGLPVAPRAILRCALHCSSGSAASRGSRAARCSTDAISAR